MTSLTASAAVVALLSTASSLSGFALALPAGAIADVLDRRRLILLTQAGQLAIAAALAVVTFTGAMTPPMLLVLTVALGAVSTLGMPAYTALTADVVDHDHLPAAISLNSVVVTASQAAGPALGGILVATAGPEAVFALNAISFVGVLAAVGRWRPPHNHGELPPEHVGAAIRTGLRYTANAPELRAVLVRAAAFVLAYSALPALLVVLTRRLWGGGPGAYGLLLGLLGIGGVVATLIVPTMRRRANADRLVVIATGGHAVFLVALAQTRSVTIAAPLLILTGATAMTTMSSLNIAAQQVLPEWLRGRGLAVFQLTFQAGYASGAAAWGMIATQAGLSTALIGAAALLITGWVLVPRYRLSAADGIDVSPAYRPEPHVDVAVASDDGPLLATFTYTLPAIAHDRFNSLTSDLRRARRREGAYRWAVFSDLQEAGQVMEVFTVSSLTEHRRQASRRTASDQQALDAAAALSTSPVTPRYYLNGIPTNSDPATEVTSP